MTEDRKSGKSHDDVAGASKVKNDAKKVLSKRTRLTHSSKFKRQVFYALEIDRQHATLPSRIVGGFLFLLIVANAVLVFLSAQPDLEPIAAHSLTVFFVFSTFCFFLEYCSRVWTADLAYGNCTRARARVKYIFSALGIIDFLSFAPSMVSWFLPVTPAIIHTVNLLRLIRLVKVTRYMRGFRTMARVMRKHYHEIVASFLVIILVMFVTCVVMYEFEHAAQPHVFTDLFQSFWFAVETVTTTGYGDIVPITTVGKICAMLVMLLALGLIAIPGGIFSAGFVAEFQNANMHRIVHDVAHSNHNENEQQKSKDDPEKSSTGDEAHEKQKTSDQNVNHEDSKPAIDSHEDADSGSNEDSTK